MVRVFIVGILVGVLIGVGGGIVMDMAEKETCHTFHVGSVNEVGMLYIGQIELCGRDMEWSGIWGPIGSEKTEGVSEGERDRGILR